MDQENVINASLRNQTGKNAARKLRQSGSTPAVLYGHNFTPVVLSLNTLELSKILKAAREGEGEHALHQIKVKERQDLLNKTVMIKDIQKDPVGQGILHVDLLAVRMDEKITVPIRISITGKAEGVKLGGILQQILREIDVKCLPSEIPRHFELDVSNLEIGHSLHVRDLLVPANIEIHADPHDTVVTVIPPTVIKEAVPEEEEAEAKPPEEEKEAAGKEETADKQKE
jgi:large subunit ribosomal protein L25